MSATLTVEARRASGQLVPVTGTGSTPLAALADVERQCSELGLVIDAPVRCVGTVRHQVRARMTDAELARCRSAAGERPLGAWAREALLDAAGE
jgi:hypothetical protein